MMENRAREGTYAMYVEQMLEDFWRRIQWRREGGIEIRCGSGQCNNTITII